MEPVNRRTLEGMERARQQGKTMGPPRKLRPGQEVEAPNLRRVEPVNRRTLEGMERARQQGKTMGPPRKLRPGQEVEAPNLRRIAAGFECSASIILRALGREGGEP